MGKTKIRIEHKKNFANLDETHKQIRGSSLLFAGKLVSVGINLAAQVIIVRYLSKTDFGAWGYVLALVAFFHAFSTLGLNRSITRFIPIYHEKDEYEKLFGTIVLVMVTIFTTSVIVVTAVFLYPELIAGLVSGNYQPVTLLFIMIFLVPVQAIDVVLLGLFASFTSPKAIFIRKYILEPMLKLCVVLLLVSLGSTVFFLAYGYLAVSIFGVVIYIWIFIRFKAVQIQHSQYSGQRDLCIYHSAAYFGYFGHIDAFNRYLDPGIFSQYRGCCFVPGNLAGGAD